MQLQSTGWPSLENKHRSRRSSRSGWSASSLSGNMQFIHSFIHYLCFWDPLKSVPKKKRREESWLSMVRNPSRYSFFTLCLRLIDERTWVKESRILHYLSNSPYLIMSSTGCKSECRWTEIPQIISLSSIILELGGVRCMKHRQLRSWSGRFRNT